jgi:hypothetical protein
MANRYWVGGTAAWDATAGTKWALTSGGAGGQAVPTEADDVFFDAASGAVTVTSSATGFCRSLNFTGFTGTFTGTPTIVVAGSVTLVTGMNFTYSGQLGWNSGSGTLISAGKTLGSVTFSSIGGTLTLGDALTCNTLTINNGTFTTNNFNVTAATLVSSNSNTRTINLGSSTVTLTGTGPWSTSTNTNLTFNAGTSSILCTGTSPSFSAGDATTGLIFYNVSFTNTGTNQFGISGVNTFNNLLFTAPASAGVRNVTFNHPTIINGTLSTSGTAGNRRLWFSGPIYGIAQTLTINSAPNLTDADFRDMYVIGTAAPVSGTRIGDLRGCSGITFSTPKTVYRIGVGDWTDNQWSATSGGDVNTDNFPLAQDTAVIDQLSTSPLTLNTVIRYAGNVDFSARTSAFMFSTLNSWTFYGNLKLGSGVTLSGTGSLTFSGRNTQTITSAGKAFSGGITVDTYGGSVELADALNILGTSNLTVTNGTFDTKSYAVTAGTLSSNNTNIRTINLGSSTLTLNSNSILVLFGDRNLLTFNAGTSQINSSISATVNFQSGGNTFYNVSFNLTSAGTHIISGGNTFNNLSITAPSAAGLTQLSLSANQIINGTLTVAGASPVRRIFVLGDPIGTPRTLTVGTLVATDCDFRDIVIAGAAANSAPTRAGDCGGNSGITFPAAKTVYWNLAGTQNWSATAWADASGGTPGVDNFPLAQDVAVFDNAGAAGTITANASWSLPTINMSSRTSALTFSIGTNNPIRIYGDLLFGTGVITSDTSGILRFSKRGISTITSNGIQFNFDVFIDSINGTTNLADAIQFSTNRQLGVTSGTFDAVTYNVTCGVFNNSDSSVRTVKMGSGTWTITAAFGQVIWNIINTNLTFYKGTANIVLSDTGTTARTFAGGGLSYNKLTIGGTTGTSTTTINDNNQFTELASTKIVAHTIALGSVTQTFGKWSVTGTAGNVVTVTGSGTSHVIAGSRVSGVDYLAMGTIGFSATSPGEFYAGANSTGTGAGVILTAAPAPTTRYWVGGTGTWDATTTTRWSDSSGGSGGATVPTSADAVIFDAASNATAYTVTCTAAQLRCGSLSISGPASGNITWAGSAPLAIHDNVNLAATGITRTYTGAITLSGSTSGKTLTTNGVQLNSNVTINGVGCEWNLGSAFIMFAGSNQITVTNGTFDTKDFNLSTYSFTSSNTNTRVIKLGASTLTLIAGGGGPIDFRNPLNLSFDCGTSTITFSTTQNTFNGGGFTFYNVTNASTNNQNFIINGINTFNNLTITGKISSGISPVLITANQTINGTLTLSAGTNATMRTFVRSDVLGTPRTLTCANFSGVDADFRDIVIVGAAAPVSGTRLGDCKGNSGITFDTPKTVYWNLAGSNNWSATAWAASAGATPAVNNFPLAQDTAVFTAASPAAAATTTINIGYNIGTIDMSARTTNTMTLATGSNAPTIYGNWVNGTGTTLSGTGDLIFAGRGSQTITSVGRPFTQKFIINTPGGSVVLTDAFETNRASAGALTVNNGNFDTTGYNLTLSGSSSSVATAVSTVGTIAVGSSTWTIAGGGSAWSMSSVNVAVTGTGTVSLTSASAKIFAGGGVSYAGITLNQGGLGTLTITGDNTFADITNTYSATAATTIALGNTTQRVGKFTASGAAGKVLTVTGTSASSPATLIYTGAGEATAATTDYLNVIGVRAYNLANTWKAGANSTNAGSLGWIFAAGTVVAAVASTFFLLF